MSKINISKINDLEAVRAVRKADVDKTDGTQAVRVENKPAVSSDKMQFSDKAAEVGKLVDQLKELPDVRQEKISALKQQVSAGEYKPKSSDIADAILKEEGNG